jgi:outer membrane protein OmpA-like peptidoglycan-associated protein
MSRLSRFLVPVILGLSLVLSAAAQDRVRITQRQDLRRQVDGKPAGLWHHYFQSDWIMGAPAADGSRAVTAWAWTTAGTVNDLSREAKELNGEYRSEFTLLADGGVRQRGPGPLPLYRGFPAPPPAGAGPGSAWEAPAVLVADPGGQGKWTRINLLVQYTWAGGAEWRGKPVLDIRAKFAVRYKAGADPAGDPRLQRAEGTRDATIYLDPVTRFPVFIRELVGHELWQFSSGQTIQNDGFILTFYEGSSFPTGLARLVAAPTPEASAGPLVADSGSRRPMASPGNAGPSSGPVTSPAPSPGPSPGSAENFSSGSTASTGPAAASGPNPSPSPSPSASPDPGRAADGPASSPSAEPPPGARPSASPSVSPDPRLAAEIIRPGYSLDPELARISQELESGGVPDVSLKTEERGINLTIENLQFQADSARLLPGEAQRLDRIASLLAKVPDGRNFLVLGHTALAGSAAGQKALSLERAKMIVDELKRRGIPAARFLYDGRGASQPVASNDTEAGRAKNRRVEIIILD